MNTNTTEHTEITWNNRLEDYFKKTGEKAHCLSILHKNCEDVYSHRKSFIDLPVIIGSGVIAFLNAGSSSLFPNPMIASVSLGIGSLVMGILNSIGTYYSFAKRAEGHRISSIQYSRLYRFLAIEMSLPRNERMTPHDLLKYTRDAYDRLQEISPLLSKESIHSFQKRFGQIHDIAKPEEVNGLERIDIFHEGQSTIGFIQPKLEDAIEAV
jgi:hypothetical protein